VQGSIMLGTAAPSVLTALRLPRAEVRCQHDVSAAASM
jgi:hypothetical protein